MRHFAKRIIVYETKADKSAQAKTSTLFPVPEKLRPHLAELMGDGGFRALLSRSLALASAEVPWLRAVRVNSEGALEGWEEPSGSPRSDELFEARVVLMAQLLGLLAAFIGENLTLGLVHQAWPKVPLNGLGLFGAANNGNSGVKNEKAKRSI
jgi:hypothetical protein